MRTPPLSLPLIPLHLLRPPAVTLLLLQVQKKQQQAQRNLQQANLSLYLYLSVSHTHSHTQPFQPLNCLAQENKHEAQKHPEGGEM